MASSLLREIPVEPETNSEHTLLALRINKHSSLAESGKLALTLDFGNAVIYFV